MQRRITVESAAVEISREERESLVRLYRVPAQASR